MAPLALNPCGADGRGAKSQALVAGRQSGGLLLAFLFLGEFILPLLASVKVASVLARSEGTSGACFSPWVGRRIGSGRPWDWKRETKGAGLGHDQSGHVRPSGLLGSDLRDSSASDGAQVEMVAGLLQSNEVGWVGFSW